MIYLDTGALVKLVRREPESDALADWLDERSETPRVSSALVDVELPRAIRRVDARLLDRVPEVLATVACYDIDELVRQKAAAYRSPELRSLDTVRLATAQAVFGRDLTAFVTYDVRLADAAQQQGLTACAPGARPLD
ncbi:type II toxin-antitoxin system VapC family toxin [Saccharomonospora xinjiangensis]|uniref:type II toxin-antitoxin system VapC family toxin n=1 Tax=Saccharomonospora xinjiangensis TaxID=75294 RepID=UPI00106F34FA|nr:type II toxin-antitoxin system VapC family toxin [Saccharomonospora xinjiangensis]QBQ62123.1 Ribonuclease VapC35 [Saccharomonospora xinjiangensis]